jgi:gliding motility associated protien GldN
MKAIRNILSCVLLLAIIGVPVLNAQSIDLIEKTEVYDEEHIPKKDPVPYPFIRESDIMYEKTVWRMINLREKMNQPLYYPLEPIGDRKNLTQLLLDILENPLPGHQVYAYKPMMTYEFQQPMSIEDIYKNLGDDADSIKDPVLDSITGQVTLLFREVKINLGNISRLAIKEKWFFDRKYSTFQVRIIGVCPFSVSMREVEDPITLEMVNTGEIRVLPLFWVYYPEIRYYLSKQEAFNPNNDAQRVSFDDLLTQRRFSSWIYKVSNVQENRTIGEYAQGMDAMFEAERIKYELFEFEHDLWEY